MIAGEILVNHGKDLNNFAINRSMGTGYWRKGVSVGCQLVMPVWQFFHKRTSYVSEKTQVTVVWSNFHSLSAIQILKCCNTENAILETQICNKMKGEMFVVYFCVQWTQSASWDVAWIILSMVNLNLIIFIFVFSRKSRGLKSRRKLRNVLKKNCWIFVMYLIFQWIELP